MHLHGLSLAHLAEPRLRNERAHVEPCLQSQRDRRLSGSEQRAWLDKAMQHHGITRRTEFGLAHDDVGLGLDALCASEFGLGLFGLPLAESLLHQPQALRRDLHAGLGAPHLRGGAIEIALRADTFLAQQLLAREFFACQCKRGNAIDTLGLGSGDFGAPAAGREIAHASFGSGDRLGVAVGCERDFREVEANEEIAGLDAIAFTHQHLDDAPLDARRDIHERGLDAAVQVHAVIDRLAAAAAGGGEADEGENDERYGNVARHRASPFGGWRGQSMVGGRCEGAVYEPETTTVGGGDGRCGHGGGGRLRRGCRAVRGGDPLHGALRLWRGRHRCARRSARARTAPARSGV